jgi:hypothetical protein
MNFAIYLGILVLLLAAALVLRQWLRGRATNAKLEARIRPVDIKCFQALQQSFDARCLRVLPARQVRAIRRRLGWAACDYLYRVHRNAALYAELGQRASRSADAEMAAAGRDLAQLAFTARLEAFHALYRTATMLVFPAQQISGAWVPQYQAVEKPFARLHALYAASAA